jgi:hypothetical protein
MPMNINWQKWPSLTSFRKLLADWLVAVCNENFHWCKSYPFSAPSSTLFSPPMKTLIQ